MADFTPPPHDQQDLREIAQQDAKLAAPHPERSDDFNGYLLVSRSRVRGYYVLLATSTLLAFFLGWLFGHSRTPEPRKVENPQNPMEAVLLTGQIRYTVVKTPALPDSSAVVIAVPKDKLPDEPLPIEGLRPWDADSPTAELHRRAVQDLGGGWARTDADGGFSLVLPRPGAYWVLVISQHLARPQNVTTRQRRGLAELDYRQLSGYFQRPEDLIGPQMYRWSLENIEGQGASLRHTFQSDAGLGVEIP